MDYLLYIPLLPHELICISLIGCCQVKRPLIFKVQYLLPTIPLLFCDIAHLAVMPLLTINCTNAYKHTSLCHILFGSTACCRTASKTQAVSPQMRSAVSGPNTGIWWPRKP